MNGNAEVEIVINSLLPISATVSSIYIVILTFIFSRYEQIGKPATPGSTIYFCSGGLLLLAFVAGAVGTLWMLGMRVMIWPYSIYPAYLLGGSFLVLLFGTILLGIGVIGTDIRKQRREIRLWATQQFDPPSSGDITDNLGFTLNPLVISGLGIGVTELGYVLILQAPLEPDIILTISVCVLLFFYGLYTDESTSLISSKGRMAVALLLLGAILLPTSGLGIYDDTQTPVHLALAIGVFVGHFSR